jgi:hypothetical protein
MSDDVTEAFPGDALAFPSDAERDRADEMIAKYSKQWRESHPPVPRVHPDTTDEGFANTLAGTPTNRAYLRAYLRRWWRKPPRCGDVHPLIVGGACIRPAGRHEDGLHHNAEGFFWGPVGAPRAFLVGLPEPQEE